jgi:hypothetical protein
MEFKDVIKLFKKACEKNMWGNDAYIQILDDGSGEIIFEDEEYLRDVVFEFDSPEDLVEKLKKELR